MSEQPEMYDAPLLGLATAAELEAYERFAHENSLSGQALADAYAKLPRFPAPKPLLAASTKGSLKRYLLWLHEEINGSREYMTFTKPLPPFNTWVKECGFTDKELEA